MTPLRRLLPLLGLLLVAACGGAPVEIGPQGVDGLEIPTPSPDPADFVDTIDNVYLPMARGSEWVYESDGGPVTVTITVADEKRVVAGIAATVVREVVTGADGQVVQEREEWVAQDREGNVWRLGGAATSYDDRGRPEVSGSWEAGVDGAEAGIAMLARPRVGDGYELGVAPGVAEDRGTVVAVDEDVVVGGTAYEDVVVVELTGPLEPGLTLRRHYAPGTGLVLEEATPAGISGRGERVELVQARLVASDA